MFSERLKELRKARGVTQEQVADRLGVKKPSISNWENDNIMPSVDMLIKIADYFQVSTDFLLGRENSIEDYLIDASGLTPKIREQFRSLINNIRKGEIE